MARKTKKRGRMDPADIQLESFFTLYLIWSMLNDFKNKNFFDLIPICHVKSVAKARLQRSRSVYTTQLKSLQLDRK